MVGTGAELNFGSRIYDSRLCKFLSTDPMEGIEAYSSPFSFAGNSPIKFIDFDGSFKMDAQFVQEYPTLAKMLQYQLPLLAQDKKVRSAWSRVTGFSEQDFVNMVTWGSGPWVTPTRDIDGPDSPDESGDRVSAVFGDNYGQFDDINHDYTNNIFIGNAALKRLEATYNTYLKTGNDDAPFGRSVKKKDSLGEASCFAQAMFVVSS